MSWIGPALSIGSAIGGLFGSRKPKLPSEVSKLYRFQFQLADQLRRQAQSTPMSERFERQGLAEQQGRLGQQQASQREQLFAGYNPDTMGGSRNDLMQTLGSEQIGQNMALQSQATLDALQYRRGLYQDAARVAAGATPAANQYGAADPQSTGLSGMFGQLSQAYARSQELKRPGAGGQSPPYQGAGYEQGPYGAQPMASPGPGLTGGLMGQYGGGQPVNMPGITPGLYGGPMIQGAGLRAPQLPGIAGAPNPRF